MRAIFILILIQMGRTHHGSLTASISLWRTRRWERYVDAWSRQGRHDWSAGPTETQGAVASGVHNALSRSQVGAMGLLRDEERFTFSRRH